MKGKIMKKFPAIILLSALLLTACTNTEPTESDTQSSSTSLSSTSSSSSDPDGSTYEDSSSSDHTQNSGSNESSAETPHEYDVVYFDDFEYDDFTEDDLWLQSFLKKNYPMALFLYCALHYNIYYDNIYELEYEINTDAEHKYQYILEYKGMELPYFIMPNTYFNNFDEFNALYQQYFFSGSIDDYRAYADIENDRIVLRDYSEPYEPLLIEINGRLYHVPIGPGNTKLPCPGMMAKVITKTEDEIVFSYFFYIDGIGNAMPGKGVLKKENGVWKFGWGRIIEPIDFQDIHEIWGV